MQKKFRTVAVFAKLGTRRFFRDRLALFFGILFPLLFLAIFGLISKHSGAPSFDVALINRSSTSFARQYADQIRHSKTFKVDTTITTLDQAKQKVSKNQLDGILILPKDFGATSASRSYPSGDIQVLYGPSNASTGQTLVSLLNGSLAPVNNKLLGAKPPLTVDSQQLTQHQLTSFDYTFAGLLGFSILGIGVFGPANYFPELKKQGILRRLRTTPLKVWQYFLATMLSQAATGLVSIGIQFLVAVTVFKLHIYGNLFEIIPFVVLSIFMILGIGLAIGGWAQNERQAIPLTQLLAFPMLFLSGTFFPRFGMPLWMQKVTDFLPLTPVIDGLRQLTTEGKHLVDIGPQIGLIALWMIVIYAIAFRVFRWE